MTEQSFILEGLNKPWRNVATYGDEQTFPVGTILDGQYKGKKVFYFLLSGTVQSIYAALDGRERIVLQFAKDCLFGVPTCFIKDMGALPNKHEENLGFFRCSSPAKVIIFSVDLLNDKDFARDHAELMINVMSSLSTVIISFFDMLTSMHLPDLRGKLARFILGMYEHNNCLHIEPNVTQTELANLLGVHRGSLARTIKNLRDQKIISGFTKKELIIFDLEALYNLLD